MSRSAKLRIICYDISNDSRRRKISRLLEDQASRVQYSVFEGRLTDVVTNRLVQKIEPLLGFGDSLRVYSISRIGERNCHVYGHGVPVEKEAGYWLL